MPLRADYANAYAAFRIADVEAEFTGSFAQGINACVECCDRWVEPGRVALKWERQDGSRGEVSFAELKRESARFANVLTRFGVKPGEVVAVMLPRGPELLTTAMGIWRAGAVYQPLFTAFGPKAIEHRLKISEARLVVTDGVNRGKLDEVAQRAGRAGGAPDEERRSRFRRRACGRGSRIRAGATSRRRSSRADVDIGHDRACPRAFRFRSKRCAAFRRLYARRNRSSPRRSVLEHRRSRLGLRPLLRRHSARCCSASTTTVL